MHGFLRSGGKYTTIDVPGAFATQPSGVNDSGQVVGTFVDPPYLSEDWVSISGASHGFLLSRGAFTTIEPDGAFESGASDVNEARQIVGWFSDVVGTHGFLLGTARSRRSMSPARLRAAPLLMASTRRARIVGSFLDATGSHGFLLAAGTFTTIDVPGAIAGTTIAYGINATGQIVGSFVDAKNVVHGFVASP